MKQTHTHTHMHTHTPTHTHQHTHTYTHTHKHQPHPSTHNTLPPNTQRHTHLLANLQISFPQNTPTPYQPFKYSSPKTHPPLTNHPNILPPKHTDTHTHLLFGCIPSPIAFLFDIMSRGPIV